MRGVDVHCLTSEQCAWNLSVDTSRVAPAFRGQTSAEVLVAMNTCNVKGDVTFDCEWQIDCSVSAMTPES